MVLLDFVLSWLSGWIHRICLPIFFRVAPLAAIVWYPDAIEQCRIRDNPWSVFCSWLSKVSTNDRKRYISNVFQIGWDPAQGLQHYTDVIMSAMASQITSLTIVYSTFYSDADQRKHQSSASLAFVWGIHRWPVNSPHKGPVTRKMLPFDDVIMRTRG